jgi:hypothetical protein
VEKAAKAAIPVPTPTKGRGRASSIPTFRRDRDKSGKSGKNGKNGKILDKSPGRHDIAGDERCRAASPYAAA